jgi:hypothetical protein
MKRALLLCCALGLLACSRSGHAGHAAPERCTEQDAGTPVDPLLLAFLSRARSAHHAADNLETNGDLSAALTPLAGLVAGPFPHNGAELAPEVHEVLADTLARLADFHSRLGAFDQALADVKAGLEHAGGPSYFQGHLLETQGLVEERRAKSLETSDPKAAAEARQRAIDLLESAMVVQSSVIEHGTQKPLTTGIPAASAAPAEQQR